MVKQGYKQTEIGVIPEQWTVSTIGAIADVKTGPFGSALHADDYVQDGTPIITVEHLGETGLTRQNLPKVSEEDRRRLSAYSMQDGDIVFSRVGSVDRNAYVTAAENGWLFSGRILRIRTKSKELSTQYLGYYFKSEDTKERIRGVAVGQTMASLNTKLMNAFKVILPTVEEQKNIAALLSDMDTLVSTLEKQISKKKAIKQGAMQELLTGKRRLPGSSGEWRTEIIPNVLQKQEGIKIGPFGSQLRKEYLLEDGPYRVYGQENVYAQDFSIGNRYLNREKYRQLQSCEIHSGDFLISTMGTVGKCAIVPSSIQPGIMDSHLIRLRINEQKLMPEYLLHLFSEDLGYLKGQTSKLSVGGIMDGLSTKIVNALNVFYPEDLSEQKAIADILSEMDMEIAALEEKLAKYRQVKQGMMQQLLTGKIRLV